jgi:hypothetical protein
MPEIKELNSLSKKQLKEIANQCLYWQEKYFLEVTTGKTDSNGGFYQLHGSFKAIREYYKLPPQTFPQP